MTAAWTTKPLSLSGSNSVEDELSFLGDHVRAAGLAVRGLSGTEPHEVEAVYHLIQTTERLLGELQAAIVATDKAERDGEQEEAAQ